MQADVKTWIAASHLVHDYWDFISLTNIRKAIKEDKRYCLLWVQPDVQLESFITQIQYFLTQSHAGLILIFLFTMSWW